MLYKKARDCFPKEYTDYIICQIAIGRLKKGTVEGYLQMEAMEIARASGNFLPLKKASGHLMRNSQENSTLGCIGHDLQPYFAALEMALEMLRDHSPRCLMQVAVVANTEVPKISAHMRYKDVWQLEAYET